MSTNAPVPSIIPVINVANDAEKKQSEYQKVFTSINKLIDVVGSLQEFIHTDILIPSVLYAWKYKDANILSAVLNKLAKEISATVRVESLQFWVSELAGFRVTYNTKDGYKVRLNYGEHSTFETKHKFSYDREHLDILRDKRYRYWKVAPVEIKIIKVSDDINKTFDPFEDKLAVSILAGQLTEDEIKQRIERMFTNVMQAKNKAKVKDKAQDFLAQQIELSAKEQSK